MISPGFRDLDYYYLDVSSLEDSVLAHVVQDGSPPCLNLITGVRKRKGRKYTLSP